MSAPKVNAIKLSFDVESGPAKKHQLSVNTGSQMNEAFVIDGNYRLVARGSGSFTTELDEGRYQLKVRVGGTTSEEWLDLTGDQILNIEPEKTIPSSSAPIDPARWPDSLLRQIQELAAEAGAAIVVRDWEKLIPTNARITLRDSQGRRQKMQRSPLEGGRIAVLRFSGLNPGPYRLQVGSLHSSPVEMCIWVAPNYQTQVYFERCSINRLGKSGSRTLKERAPLFRTAAVTMLGLNETDVHMTRRLWLLTEMARGSLAELREVKPMEETLEAVFHKVECPMLGLLGAHLLLNAMKPGDESMDSLMETVVDNLARILGEACPDVAALRYARTKDKSYVLRMPPMIWQSWNILAPNADVKNIPRGSLASQIGVAVTALRPWLIWKTELLPQGREDQAAEPQYLERVILETKKTHRKVGQLAVQYSLPRSTVKTILDKL